jgi:hypothetical protein
MAFSASCCNALTNAGSTHEAGLGGIATFAQFLRARGGTPCLCGYPMPSRIPHAHRTLMDAGIPYGSIPPCYREPLMAPQSPHVSMISSCRRGYLLSCRHSLVIEGTSCFRATPCHAPYRVSMSAVIVAPLGSARLQLGHAATGTHRPSLRVHKSNQAEENDRPHPVQWVSRLHKAASMAIIQSSLVRLSFWVDLI